MILNEKLINYKVLDHINLYNFGIKFNFIRDYIKIAFLGAGDTITCL
jgi:hypothetical protein